MIKSTVTLMVMFTLDFTDVEICRNKSIELYGEDRCYESYDYYAKLPEPKPKNFLKMLYASSTVQ